MRALSEPTDPVRAAWQDALAAEHAAVYGYGELGPVLDQQDARALARTDEDAHRALRDATAATIAGFGLTPVASRPYYPPPFPLTDAAAATRYAVLLEESCAAAWRYLIAAAASSQGAASAHAAGQAGLTGSAIRALQWRVRANPAAPTVAFPGIQPGSR